MIVEAAFINFPSHFVESTLTALWKRRTGNNLVSLVARFQECLPLRALPPLLLPWRLRQRQTVLRQPLAKNLLWLRKRSISVFIVVVVSVDQNIDLGTKDRVSYIYTQFFVANLWWGSQREGNIGCPQAQRYVLHELGTCPCQPCSL